MRQKTFTFRVKSTLVKIDPVFLGYVRRFNWYITPQGYIARKSGQQTVLLHRDLMRAGKGVQVDHKNGDRLDNRMENLRLCDYAQNNQNRGKHKDGVNPYKCVYFYPERKSSPYLSKLCYQRKQIVLGRFKTAEDAALAYDLAASLLYKEFAYLNLPQREPSRLVRQRVTAVLTRKGYLSDVN